MPTFWLKDGLNHKKKKPCLNNTQLAQLPRLCHSFPFSAISRFVSFLRLLLVIRFSLSLFLHLHLLFFTFSSPLSLSSPALLSCSVFL